MFHTMFHAFVSAWYKSRAKTPLTEMVSDRLHRYVTKVEK